MYHYFTIIHHQPASVRFPFDATFPLMLCTGFLDHPVGQGIQHAATGGSTYNEIIREWSVLFDIQQEDVFTFFVFQFIDDGMGKF